MARGFPGTVQLVEATDVPTVIYFAHVHRPR